MLVFVPVTLTCSRARGQLPPADLEIALDIVEPGRSATLTALSASGERLLAASRLS